MMDKTVLSELSLEEAMQLAALRRELAIAQEMQTSLLPAATPAWPDLEVVCYSTPAKEIGGDFYTYDGSQNDRVLVSKYLVAVGDVSGKGISAALLMATSLSRVDAAMSLDMTPAERLIYLDQVLLPYTKTRRQNCALCLLEFVGVNTRHPFVKIVNAGGIPPYIRRVDGTIYVSEIGGFALGQGVGAGLGYEEERVKLQRGDLLVLVSDGVVEAMNGRDEMFGFDRLEQAIADFDSPEPTAPHLLEHLKHHVAQFVAGSEQHDDMTIVVVRI